MSTFRSILAPHKTSLKSIELEGFGEGRRGLEEFDLTDFESLEELTLFYSATGCDTGYEANLLAPNLRTFRWHFDDFDQQHAPPLWLFGQPQQEWLRRLTTAAIASRSSLRRIEICFHPDFDHGIRGSEEERKALGYPWDRMDAIAEEIQSVGIELTYNSPTVTREVFNNLVKYGSHIRWDETLGKVIRLF